MQQRGHIISIEGFDGTGKDTIATALYDYLNEQGLNYEKRSYPTYNEISSNSIVDYQKGLMYEDVSEDPFVSMIRAALPYMNDRYYDLFRKDPATGKCVYERIHEGQNLIFDRYNGSNYMYQTRHLPIDDVRKGIDMMKAVENGQNGLRLPEPDVTFLLIGSYKMSMDNIKKRHSIGNEDETKGRPSDDILENLETFEAIFERIDEIVEKENWKVIHVCDESGYYRDKLDIVKEIVSKI